MKTNNIRLDRNAKAAFNNKADSCIGTGRMGLALQKEYQEQLKFVQDIIGFKYIRGHGLFSDDMAVYQQRDFEGGIIEYNFTYLDMVMDNYLANGIRPYLELGFMPSKLASGTQTIFYWKGNTTPPRDYEEWKKLIRATLMHLIERYGREEVLRWPVEVWNEPNLPGFWLNADKQEYFKLYRESLEAVKSVDPGFRVGGPAVCGGSDREWIRAFMDYCHENGLEVDFVSRHHYATTFPERDGHYGYAELMDPENPDDGFPDLHSTREIIEDYPEYAGTPIHITEFNTSYIPNCPLHDTNQNAAYIAHQLSRLGDDNEVYSYWTFGDIFEEGGVPFAPFHGGFGLVANGCIPKPTFWSFAFFKELKEGDPGCIYRDDTCVIVKRDRKGQESTAIRGVAWNMTIKRSGDDMVNRYTIEAEEDEYVLITKTVDEVSCNPLKAWHDLGEPRHLSASQKDIIKSCAYPLVRTSRIKPTEGKVTFEIELKENAVVFFELAPVKTNPDRGYDYDRVMQYGL